MCERVRISAGEEMGDPLCLQGRRRGGGKAAEKQEQGRGYGEKVVV